MYPSFLFIITPRPNSGEKTVISESVLKDLNLSDEFRQSDFEFLLTPVTSDEIRARQGLFRLILSSEEFADKIRLLRDFLSDAQRLYLRYRRSENDTEKILLFPTILSHCSEICSSLSRLSGYPGRAGEIGQFYSQLLSEPAFAEAMNTAGRVLSRRPGDIVLTLHSSDVHAYEGSESVRNKLEEIFESMGLGDSVTPTNSRSFASPATLDAYNAVYPAYYEAASNLHSSFSRTFTDGEYSLDELFAAHTELSFLLNAARYFTKLEKAGFPLCYPEVSENEKKAVIYGLRDPSLIKRDMKAADIVSNDIAMYKEHGGEKLNFFILTGANGGGKTTFLRSVTAAVMFFITGCPVPAERGEIYPFTSLYTHFPADENFGSGGRFADECSRAEEITSAADENTFAAFNETFSGTDEKKSEDYSLSLAEKMFESGVFGIFVTHIHSLTGGKIPTLAAVIDENDENRRTYRIKRVGSTDSSFAEDILRKYRLDRTGLEDRLRAIKTAEGN